jgi:glutamate dehydrogenase
VLGDVSVWQQVEALDNKVADAVQSEMLIEEGWLTARATTWFLRSRRLAEPMEETFRRFIPAVQALRERLEPAAAASPMAGAWIAAGVPPPLAHRVASAGNLVAALDVAEVAEAVRRGFDEVSEVHVGVGTRLGLSGLRQQIDALPSDSHWQGQAKAALGDDLAGLQRAIAQDVLGGGAGSPAELLAAWETSNAAALERAQRLLAELGDAKGADLAMLSVALRELRNLA